MLARSALEVDFETLFLTVSAEERTENCGLVKVSFAPVEVELVALSKCSRSALEVLSKCSQSAPRSGSRNGCLGSWLAGCLADCLAVNCFGHDGSHEKEVEECGGRGG